MTCNRATRLDKLQQELSALTAEGKATAPISPERDAVLERSAPVHAAVMVLKEELAV
jgi:hypothetical protein